MALGFERLVPGIPALRFYVGGAHATKLRTRVERERVDQRIGIAGVEAHPRRQRSGPRFAEPDVAVRDELLGIAEALRERAARLSRRDGLPGFADARENGRDHERPESR